MILPSRRTLLCVLTCVAAAFVAASAQGASFPFITTFGSDSVGQLPAGWSADLSSSPAVSAAAAAPSDAQSVAFTANGQGMKTPAPTADVIQWDFWVRPTGTGRSLTIGTTDSSSRYGIWLTFGSPTGQVSYFANNTWNPIAGTSYSANQWYKVRIVGRLSPSKSFDFYMSPAGSGVLPDLPQGRGLPVRDPLTSDFTLARVGTYGFSATAYFDDASLFAPETDGFESNAVGVGYPDGWKGTGSSAPEIVSGGSDGSSRSLNLYQSGNRLELPLEEVADEVVADFKAYPTGLGRSLTFTFFDQAHQMGPYLSLGVASGQLSYYANGAWSTVPGVTFSANAWHRIRIVVRTLPIPSFDVFVSAAGSDTLPATPQGANLPFRDAATDFASFGLDAFGLTTACRVDGVEITQGLEPLAPALGLPAANATTYMPVPSFEWQGSYTSERYEIQISSNAAFSTLLDSDAVAINRYVHAQPFSTGDLYWRVRARGAGNLTSEFSAGRKLTILTPANIYNIPAGASAATIQSTIQGAVTPAVVNFAAGQNYTLAPTGSALFSVSGKSDLIINGNGANITFTNPMCGLAQFNNCNRVLVRDLTVDFDPVPFSVGTIVSTNSADGSFTMTLDSGMPAFNAPHMLNNWTWGVLLDPNVPGRLKAGAPLVINTVSQYVVQNGNQYTLKLTSPSQLSHFTPGTKYIQFARTNGGKSLVSVTNSNDLTCSNITNHAISAGHYSFLDGGGLKLLGCRSLIKAGRWFGGNADGVHVRYTAPGPWVEGCEFEGVGDDSVALYSKGVFIQQKLSNTQLRLGTEFFNLTPGTRFTVFNPRDGQVVAQDLEVVSSSPLGSPVTAYDVTFTPPLTVALQTSDPDPLKNDQVFNSTRLNKGFVLRGNTFRNIRRYGSVIRASSGIIDGNTYEGISDIPIVFRNEPDNWRNGLQSTDIQVTRNVIIDSGFSPGAQDRGQIHLSIYKLGNVYGAWRGHRRIVIADNEIWNWQQRGIEVRNAGELTIANNLITAEPGVSFTNTRAHYGILVENCEDSLLFENDIVDPRSLTAPINVFNSDDIKVVP